MKDIIGKSPLQTVMERDNIFYHAVHFKVHKNILKNEPLLIKYLSLKKKCVPSNAIGSQIRFLQGYEVGNIKDTLKGMFIVRIEWKTELNFPDKTSVRIPFRL